MPFRTTLLRSAAVATAGLLALPAAPAWAADTTVLDVLKVVDGEYVVATVHVPARTAVATAEELEERPDVVVASASVTYQVDGTPDTYRDTTDPQHTSKVRDVWPRTRGEGQIVAVLDTAVDPTHEDLFGAVLPGADFAGGSGSNWHGTGVAGVIAARADNGIGMAGMAPAAKILPVRVCNDTGCPSAAIARGILWAADHGADVINMSLSGVGYSDVSAAAVQYALDKGISVLAATGNDGLNGNPVMYPAALSGVIGVSSTTPTGGPSDWAVHGWQTDVSTVGDSVTLTMPGDAYGSGSGTSFSTPAVAGVAALLRSSHPGISPADLQAALQAGSDSTGTWNRAYGAGRLDAPAAMAAADRLASVPRVTGSSGVVDVEWDAVDGASGYTVRVDGVVRAQVTTTTTRITGLTDGNQVAVDVQADAGSRSRAALATVAPTAPAVPTLHSASLRGTGTSAILDLSASVTGQVAPRYAIIRDGVSLGSITWSMTSTPTTKSIGIGAMPTAQTRWQLRPIDTYAQMGPTTNTVTTGSAVPAPPGAPTGLAGRIQGDELLLTWDEVGRDYTYRVSVGGSVVATPSTAGVTLQAPARGETETYAVVVVDNWSQAGPSATTTVTHALSAPDAPVIATPVRRSGAIEVRWNAPAYDGGTAITGYTVSTVLDGAVVGTTSTGPDVGRAVVSGLTNGVAYTFVVAATNAVGTGATSAPSSPVIPATTPGEPVIGTSTPGDGSVVVRWAPPTSTGGAPVTGYVLTTVRSGGTPVTTSAAADATTATVTGLTNGTSYTVTVAARNDVGTGAARAAVVTPSATPTVPRVPLIGTPTPGDGSAVVRWAPPSDDGGAPLTGYTVIARVNGVPVRTTTAPPSATSAIVSDLANGTPHTFTVAASNAVGIGTTSAASANVIPGGPVTVPGAPTIGTPVPGDGWVVVRWTAPTNTGGSPLTGFVVRGHRGDGTLASTVNVRPEDTSTYVTGLTNGTSYTFTVHARNAAGTGPGSAATTSVTPRPPATAPGAPVVGTVTPGDRSAHVMWTPPASDGGSPITGFTVLGWTGGAPVSSTSVAGDATSASVQDLQNGTPYTFTIAATNAAGIGEASAPSTEVIPSGSTPSPTVASAPTIGTPTTYRSTARVRWTPPAHDGGSTITGYEVRTYRSGVLVTTTSAPAGVTSTAIAGLTYGRSHTFAVAAVNAVGTGPLSVRSTAVTPRTVPGAPKVASVTAARKAVVVKWTAPTSNGGAAVTGYVVRTYSGGKLVKSTTVRATARSVTVTALSSSRSYTFRVQAKNVVGAGAWSAASTVVRPNR